MSRSKTPTQRDRTKLELFHRFLKSDNLKITCGCGEDESCSECGIELTSDDLYVRHHDGSRLSLRVSLSNLDPKSKLAVRYNADDEFADIVDMIEDEMELSLTQPGGASSEDLRTIQNVLEAAKLISQIKGSDVVEMEQAEEALGEA